MTKLIIILFTAVLVSGCGLTDKNTVANYNEKSLDPQTSTYSEGEVMNRIIELRNGVKPMEKGTSNPAASQNQSQTQNQAAPATPAVPAPMQLENLAKDYNFAILKTNLGDIKVGFYSAESPLTVNNFLNLAKKGFYDSTKFHRVIKDFMIQGGDPNSKDDDWSDDGVGGPGYKFADEFNQHPLVRGSLAMANSGANTNGSQFFIVTKDATPWLDGKHTNFGYVIEGADVVAKIEALSVNENDHPTEDAVISSIELIK